MARCKNLEIEGWIELKAAGDVFTSFGTLNNFADNLTINIADQSGGADTDGATNLRAYPSGKPVNPASSFDPVGALNLVQDEQWDIELILTDTAGIEKLTYSFSMFSSSSKDQRAYFKISGISNQI